MKRLIISDLHIGSKHTNEESLVDFLSDIECDELILAGDIIDFIKIPQFTNKSRALFKIIDNFNRRIIYIIGNHDRSFQGLVGKEAFGVTFVDKYEFVDGKRKYRIEHGDKYEKGIVHWRFFMKLVSIIQDFMERYMDFDISTWYRNLISKKRKLRRIWDIVQWNEDADVFIMGHTHNPEVLIWVDKNERIKTYINTGDWVENCTYVIIKNGEVRLRKWNE